jgi:guanylate kinase
MNRLRAPLLITVTGPSGTGKDAVIKGLTDLDPTIQRFTTATTRAPRIGEVDGVNYHYLSRERFEEKLANGEFLEHNPSYHTNLYGTLRADVEAVWAKGADAISDINIKGVLAFREKLPAQHFAILLMPPSRERLFQRLTQRNPELSEDGKIRFKAAEPDLDHLHDPHYMFTNPDMRGSKLTDYDAVFTNDDLEVTTYAVHARILAERAKRAGVA